MGGWMMADKHWWCRIKDINTHCLQQFNAHWECLENNNHRLWECRKAEMNLNSCVFEKLVCSFFLLSPRLSQRYTPLNCTPSYEIHTDDNIGPQKNHSRHSRKRRPRALASQAAVRPVQRSPMVNQKLLRKINEKKITSQDALWQYFMLIFLSFFPFLNSFGLDLALLQGMRWFLWLIGLCVLSCLVSVCVCVYISIRNRWLFESSTFHFLVYTLSY